MNSSIHLDLHGGLILNHIPKTDNWAKNQTTQTLGQPLDKTPVKYY